MHPPQEIPGTFLIGGLLECLNPQALGIHPGKNVFHHPVFPAGIHGLDDEQQAMLVLGVENFLLGLDAVSQMIEKLQCVPLVAIRAQLAAVRQRLGQFDLAALRNQIRLAGIP